MASSKVTVPDFLTETISQWNPIDQGRIGGVFTLLSDDDWRFDHRVDWGFSETQQVALGLAGQTVWAVAHAGVTVGFIETQEGEVGVVYVNRRSLMHPGWL